MNSIEHLLSFSIFFPLLSHVIRAVFVSYEIMEVTGPQMMLTMKLTTFAWNVYDGRRKVEVRLSAFAFYEPKKVT